jgi:23S rRNA pseudouridine955/2504/2580 synthase
MRQWQLKRLFLHAEKLEMTIPDIDFTLSIQAPLPQDLQHVLSYLDSNHVKTN